MLAKLISETMAEAHIDPAMARLMLDEEDPDHQTILFWYRSVAFHQEGYIPPAAKIEAGAKSALEPHQAVTIHPFVAEEIAKLSLAVLDVTTVVPERSFWDRVVMLHGLRRWYERRGVLWHQGQRVSRHYYDVHSMLLSGKIEKALSDFDLGRDCVRNARMFFGSPDLDLEKAHPGIFALVPSEGMIGDLRRDYERMAGMIIGPAPAFNSVIESIHALEERLNRNA